MKIGILALGRPTFDVQYAKERLTASLNYLSSTNHNILGSCELLLDEQDALNEINKFKNEDLDFIIIIQVTFTDSSTLLKIASCLEKPIGIWAFPEPRQSGRLRLNAFCGLNLASHTLGLNNIPFSWIYENPESIEETKFEILINSNNSKRPWSLWSFRLWSFYYCFYFSRCGNWSFINTTSCNCWPCPDCP